MWISWLVLVAIVQDAVGLKIYAAGSGSNMLSLAETANEIIELSGLATPSILYLGTATYDDVTSQETQTRRFIERGCTVVPLRVAVASPSFDELVAAFNTADVVLVSGGNTLFAYDRWVSLGMDFLIAKAGSQGVVLAGGSAGGIVWFAGGHSDSMSPATYKNPPGPFLNPNMPEDGWANWAYIRTPGLTLLPGLFCPHYDVTQSNGVLRASDFVTMLQQHPAEVGIGVDNWAALIINGDEFSVISRTGQPGSVDPNGNFTPDRDGRPGIWRLTMDIDGEQQRVLVPYSGPLSFLIATPRYVSESLMLPVARAQNPDDGIPPTKAWNTTEF